jgi:putative AbiEi antitoxin of type IV toxin-antitoxin system
MKVPAPYEAIIRSARAQYGLVTREQVLEAGHSPAQLEHLVRSRRWERIHRSVYRVGGVPETHEQRILAAVLGAGPGALASHLAAGFLWKLRGVVPDQLDVTVESGRQPKLRGVHIHRVNRIPEEDRREVRGIPTTSVPRLLVDLSAFWSPGQLRVALDEMLRRHETTLGSVERCVRRLESARGRRCAVIEALVKERKDVPLVGESHLEQRLFEPLLAAGVDLPVPQFEVLVDGQRFRLDFAWPDAKLYVEVDGFDTHGMHSDPLPRWLSNPAHSRKTQQTRRGG